MPARDILIQSAIQVALIFEIVCSFSLAFGLSIVAIISYRLHKEEQRHA